MRSFRTLPVLRVEDGSSSSTWVSDAATGLWEVDQLKLGHTATLEIEVDVTGTGDIVNVAEVWESHLPDPDSAIGQGSESEDDFASVAITASSSQAKLTATEAEAGVPTEFALGSNYPNPFNPETVIPYAVAESGPVRIAVYDVLGREVAVLVAGTMSPGRYEAVWWASDAPSGVYVVRLEAGSVVKTRRVVLMK